MDERVYLLTIDQIIICNGLVGVGVWRLAALCFNFDTLTDLSHGVFLQHTSKKKVGNGNGSIHVGRLHSAFGSLFHKYSHSYY